MGLIKKLLGRGEAMISVAEHEQALADLGADMAANFVSKLAVERTQWRQEIGIERDTVARLVATQRQLKEALTAAREEREALRIKVEAYAADATLWRAAREKRKQTGRLVPRVKAEVEANV